MSKTQISLRVQAKLLVACHGEDFSNISYKNYANILKVVHENPENYLGKKIKFTGYVYRVFDLNDNQFVLARDMIISSDGQTVVIGFLCEYKNTATLKDNTWVEVCGEIKKGNYHGDMPILKVLELKVVEKPDRDEFVYPPDDNYVPTINLL